MPTYSDSTTSTNSADSTDSTDSDDDGYEAEGIIDRKLILCPRLQSFRTKELILSCSDCENFFLYCCHCSYLDGYITCHHFRLVFTDGACRRNGQHGATAGLGVAYGKDETSQYAISVTEEMDAGQKRTSQRTELLAAITGLEKMIEAYNLAKEQQRAKKKRRRHDKKGEPSEGSSWVVVTDSEYVVKGMTEWFPTWKRNKMRTNRNTNPSNVDLFLRLDSLIMREEAKREDLKIGFWHVPRKYNTVADRLAKEAAESGEPSR